MELPFIKLKRLRVVSKLSKNYNIFQPKNLKIRYILGYLISMSASKSLKIPSISLLLVLKVRKMITMKMRPLKKRQITIIMEMNVRAVMKKQKMRTHKMMDTEKKEQKSKMLIKKKKMQIKQKTQLLMMIFLKIIMI